MTIAAHVHGDEIVEGMEILDQQGEWLPVLSVAPFGTPEWPFFLVVTLKVEDQSGYATIEEAYAPETVLVVRYDEGLVQ